MSDLNQRIEAMYRGDGRGAWFFVAALWVVILFVLFMSWPHIPDSGVRIVALDRRGRRADLQHRLGRRHGAATTPRTRNSSTGSTSSISMRCRQAKALRGPSWQNTRLPNNPRPCNGSTSSSSSPRSSWPCGCRCRPAGPASRAPSRRSTTRPGKRSEQTPAQVEQWVKLGFADAAAAHDIIQNKFDYTHRLAAADHHDHRASSAISSSSSGPPTRNTAT